MSPLIGDVHLCNDSECQTPSALCAHPLRRRVKKKALSIAIRYHELSAKHPEEEPKLELPFGHKDPGYLNEILTKVYGYKESDITILMDDPKHFDKYENPTRQNILKAMEELIRDAEPGDHLVFHYAGHGSQVRNLDNTEEDGYDEVIWPTDVEFGVDEEGNRTAIGNYIKDDTLKVLLVDSLPEGVRMTAILDCCHSGTGLDLPETYTHENSANVWSPMVFTPTETNPSPFALFRGRVHPRAPIHPQLGSIHLTFEAEAEVAPDGRLLVHPHGPQPVHTPVSDHPSALITSWSACLDDQVELESSRGGVFIRALKDVILYQHRHYPNAPLTNLQVLQKLSQKLFDTAVKAKPSFRQMRLALTPPKPVLGSLVESSVLLNKAFVL